MWLRLRSSPAARRRSASVPAADAQPRPETPIGTGPIPRGPQPVAPGAAPPPWAGWVEPVVEEARPAERVVADVRAAIVEVLERQGDVVPIGPDEFVSIAIDFQSREPWPHGPEHSLQVRARRRDLQEYRAGTIDQATLRQRIVVVEE